MHNPRQFANIQLRRKHCALIKDQTTTILRKTELLEKRNALRHHINAWFAIQDLYMPEAQQLRQSRVLPIAPYAEDERLYLP